MSADFSKAAMLRYLGNVTRQGDLNANTAGGLRAAAVKLLEDVSDDDDVSNVDVDAMAIRYHNKHPGELSTDSLVIYKRRLTRLIDDFKQYVTNPLEFKPKSRPIGKSGEKGNARSGAKVEQQSEETTPTPAVAPSPTGPGATKTLLNLPYPLRDDFVANIVIPRNITSDEAKRLCAFITTLAVDFKP